MKITLNLLGIQTGITITKLKIEDHNYYFAYSRFLSME